MRSKSINAIIMTSDEVSTAGHFNWPAQPLLGIFLNEVGNLTDLFNDDDKRKFNTMMSEAFILATGGYATTSLEAGRRINGSVPL